ncbi:hypothetical protein M885DRAFT_541420 [Pelagophyceae sp. CCMP2097]|nr:hypothetical protein M885DRAFT_541420 [Pelagophyceae sp. CCMP2097]
MAGEAAALGWIRELHESVARSDDFRRLWRDLTRRVEAGGVDLRRLGDDEQRAAIERTYADAVGDGAARDFERCVGAGVDVALGAAVSAARLGRGAAAAAEAVVETIEREASDGVVALLASLPRESSSGALRRLLGRVLPPNLRAFVWRRELFDRETAIVDFDARQATLSVVALISASDARITSRCGLMLDRRRSGDRGGGEYGADALVATKAALSYVDARLGRGRERRSLSDEALWLALPLLDVALSAPGAASVHALTRALVIGVDAVLSDGLEFALDAQSRNALPAAWVARTSTLLAEADADLFAALDGGVERVVADACHGGLARVLCRDVVLYVWDQCVVASFDSVLPLAAATLLLALRGPLLERLPAGGAADGRRALDELGPGVPLVRFAALFAEHAVPRLGDAGAGRAARAAAEAADDGGAPARGEALARVSPRLLDAALPRAALRLDRRETPQALADGGCFTPEGPLTVDVGGQAVDLVWAEVTPAVDTLADVVDRLLERNAKAFGALDGTALRRAAAIGVARLLPGLAALYDELPKAIEKPLRDALRAATRLRVNVADEGGATAAALGERRCLELLVSPEFDDAAYLSPGAPLLAAATVLALRAARDARWPRSRDDVPAVVAAAADALRKRRDTERSDADAAKTAADDEEASLRLAAAGREKTLAAELSARRADEARLARRRAADAATEHAAAAAAAAAACVAGLESDLEAARGAAAAAAKQLALIDAAVSAAQRKVFGETFDAAALAALNAKGKANLKKKHAKWVKELRAAYTRQPELRDAVGAEDRLAALLSQYEPR